MTYIIIVDQLNPETFDILMEDFFNNTLIEDRNKPIKITVHFLDGKGVNAYPKFEHRLKNFHNLILTKAEIAGYLYLHYMYNDIEDDFFDHVIFEIS